MKVLHLIDSGGLYGAEKAMLALAQEQMRRGHDVRIGTITPPGEIRQVEVAARSHGYVVSRIELAPGLRPASVGKLGKALRPHEPEVVHTHGYKPNVLMALQPTSESRPAHVVTLHGWTSVTPWTRNAFYERLDRALLFRADATVIVSESMRVRLPRSIGIRAKCIRNGIPLAVSDLHEVPAEIAEFCARGPTVVCVGRLAVEKDQSTILRALSCLPASSPLQALFLGEGPLQVDLAGLATQLGIERRVHFAGYVEDAWRTFSRCRAMVISSVTEGLPLALLEAMRARLPVLTTPVGEIPAATSGPEGAGFFPVGDSRALAALLQEVLARPAELAERAERANRRFVESFSVARAADGYDVLYTLARDRIRSVTH